ncbi:MAG: hypothetical protein HEP71_10130 [Roseivirga sp.]|nr:hypothetical protein [Roseivirga sp.]
MSNSKQEIENKYTDLIPKYTSLGKNVSEALGIFLKEAGISYLTISFRVKEVESFLEKIDRKNYTDPFIDIEDICGTRIICFYQSDVERICEIVNREFDIKESQDKEDLLKSDQFGYRSHHLIGQIKNSWLKTPNYKNLKNLKIEFQVRTILMHAWAEIEHKLAYKQKIHIPPHLERKLFRISAKLEESDEQFEEIKAESIAYRNSLIKNAEVEGGHFPIDTKLDLDSLQAFLDFYFSDRSGNIDTTRDLLNELLKDQISIKDIIEGLEKVKPHLKEIEIETFPKRKITKPQDGWAQVGIVRAILDLTNDKYFEARIKEERIPDFVVVRDKEWRSKLNTV